MTSALPETLKIPGMKHRTIPYLVATALVVLAFASPLLAQRSSPIPLKRDDFINELFTAAQTARTIWYDAALPESYLPNKSDLLSAVPDGAKARGLNLRTLFVVGPTNLPMQVYYVYAFVDEDKGVRVYQQTFAQNKITYKSTRVLTQAEFQGFVNELLRANVLDSGKPSANNEGQYELMLARWMPDKIEVYLGTYMTQKPKARVKEFGMSVGNLLRSLTKTYPNLMHTQAAPTPRPPKKP